MILPEKLLLEYDAEIKEYSLNEFIFKEGNTAKYYYQIKTGTVKISNSFENAKEIVHGFPYEGLCFGESYLFTDLTYAVDAVAISECEIFRLCKETFLQLNLNEPEICLRIHKSTADRFHFRYLISSFLSISDPQIKIIKLFDHLKYHFDVQGKHTFVIPFTRLQISTLIGLRVETVIKTIKKMETEGILIIDSARIRY